MLVGLPKTGPRIVTIQIKASEMLIPVVLFYIMLYKVVLSIKEVHIINGPYADRLLLLQSFIDRTDYRSKPFYLPGMKS